MEAIVPLLFLVGGLALAIWVVRTYHRPRTRAGILERSAPSFPAGTRAFEAEMSLGIIETMIHTREMELARSSDHARTQTLERQLANLRKQAQIHRATIASGDLSRGRMSIGVDPDSDRVD